MDRLIGLALAAVGVVLLYFGWEAQQSIGSQISQMVQGSPSDQALWFFVGGAACLVVGLAIFRRFHKRFLKR